MSGQRSPRIRARVRARRVAEQFKGSGDAPRGAIWVCIACGKTSSNRYEGPGWWDASCMMNAELCRDDQTLVRGDDGRVKACEPFKGGAA